MKEAFYYSVPGGLRYSNNPPGELDIELFLNGQPFFVSSTGSTRRQKKLVIADWSAKNWSDEKLKTVQIAFKKLLDEGFQLYIEQHGKVVPLRKEALSSLHDKLKYVSTTSNLSIDLPSFLSTATAPGQGFTQDNTYLLDYCALNHLLKGKEDVPVERILYERDYNKLQKSDQECLMDRFRRGLCVFDKVFGDTFDGVSGSHHKSKFLAFFRSYPSIEQYYETVNLTEGDIQTLRDSGCLKKSYPSIEQCFRPVNLTEADVRSIRNFGHIEHYSTTLTREQFSRATKLQVPMEEDRPGVMGREWEVRGGRRVLRAPREPKFRPSIKPPVSSNWLSNFETLDLFCPTGFCLLEQAHHLPKLKDVRLRGPAASKIFQLLWAAAPNLESISTNGHDIKLSDFFQNLKKIVSYAGRDLTVAILQRILEKNPGLNTLALDTFGDKNEDLQLKEGSLPDLEVLELTCRTIITTTNLEMLKKAAPNLKKLRLEDDKHGRNPAIKAWIAALRQERPQLMIEGDYANDIDSAPPDPVYNPEACQSFTPNKAPFRFSGTNTTKNQAMIVEKFSQYLNLVGTEADRRIIPNIQDGMCLELAHYFRDSTTATWDEFIEAALQWKGQSPIPAVLRQHFPKLQNCVVGYQSGSRPVVRQYLGNHLNPYLVHMEKGEGCVIGNPRHVVAIKCVSSNEWQIYDPEAKGGYKTVKDPNVLIQAVYDSLGPVVSLHSDIPIPTSNVMDDPDVFLKHGGLITLTQCENVACILAVLDQHEKFSIDALSGLLYRGASGELAWVIGKRDPLTAALTERLLQQFRDTYPDPQQALDKSMSAMQAPKQQQVPQLLPPLSPRPNLPQLVQPPDQASAANSSAQQQPLLPEPNLPQPAQPLDQASASDNSSTQEHVLRSLLTGSNSAQPEGQVSAPNPWIAHYETLLEAGKTSQAIANTPAEYTKQCLDGADAISPSSLRMVSGSENTPRTSKTMGMKSCLIRVTSATHLHSLRFALQARAEAQHRPLFYIHSPEELTCTTRVDEHGVLHMGAEPRHGGPLYDFLRENADGTCPVLLINYDKFSHADIKRFKSMLGVGGNIDGVTLPDDARLIGLVSPRQQQASLGHFDKQECCPNFSTDDWASAMLSLPEALASPTPIDLLPNSTAAGTTLPFLLGLESSNTAMYVPVLRSDPPRTSLAAASFERGLIEEKSEHQIINLFQDPHWKRRLLGRWMPNAEGGFTFEAGALQQTKAGSTVEIQNGPWDDEEFRLFWQDIRQHKRVIDKNGVLDLRDRQFVCSNDYDWPALRKFLGKVETDASHHKNDVVLTPQHLHLFSRGPACDRATRGFTERQGLIQRHSGQTLGVYVTRTLSEDQWAMILTECHAHDVKLDVHCNLGVTLPANLLGDRMLGASTPPARLPWVADHPLGDTEIIASTDVDTTVAMLTQHPHLQWQVMDVSERGAADLLVRIEKHGTASVEEHDCALVTGLQAGKNILLKGKFSAALADQLAPFLLQRLKGEAHLGGRLCIVSDNTDAFQYIPTTQHHKVTPQNKVDCLKKRYQFEDEKEEVKDGAPIDEKEEGRVPLQKLAPYLYPLNLKELGRRQQDECRNSVSYVRMTNPVENNPRTSKTMGIDSEPLSTLEARCDILKRNPASHHGDEAWAGLHHTSDTPLKVDSLNIQNAVSDAAAFHQQRRATVNHALRDKPYVLAVSFSGTGKTTFLTQSFKEPEDTLFIAKDINDTETIKAWAKHQQEEGRALLFLDEITLSGSDCSQFEDLFHGNILVDGECLELTPEHKVLFAGNPVDYSDDRKAADFFKRHGNTCVFDPLPTSVLYADVLVPLFKDTPLIADADAIIAHFLKVYERLVGWSKTDVLISPRELEMMALLTISQHATQGGDPMEIARHHAFTLGRNLVPLALQWKFDHEFKPTSAVPPPKAHNQTSLLTSSRWPVCRRLDDLLVLRQWRQTHAATLTTQQLYGGLGGLTIESELESGTRELIFERLEQAGFQISTDLNQPAANTVYHIAESLGLSQTQKEAAVLALFHKGAVVVIENTDGMEHLLNSLLMGRTPQGDPADKPGFTLINLRGPTATTQGQSAMSTAALRRNDVHVLPPQTHHEVIQIFQQKGLSDEKTEGLAIAFDNQKKEAKKEKHAPPSFERVLDLAKETLAEEAAQQRKQQSVAGHPSSLWQRRSALTFLPADKFSHSLGS